MAVLIIFIIWFAIPIILLIYSIRNPPFFTVQEQQAVIIERFGRFHKVAGSGHHFMLPGIDRRRKFKDGESLIDYVDLRERTIKVSPQNVITKDNIHLLLS